MTCIRTQVSGRPHFVWVAKDQQSAFMAQNMAQKDVRRLFIQDSVSHSSVSFLPNCMIVQLALPPKAGALNPNQRASLS